MELIKVIKETKSLAVKVIYSHQEEVFDLISPYYECGYLLKGKAQIILKEKTLSLTKGSFFEILPNTLHHVKNISKKGLWVVFYYKEDLPQAEYLSY